MNCLLNTKRAQLLLTLIVCLIFAAAAPAQAIIIINEVLGSTTGIDLEFIELYNTGASAVDISDWRIELWDSDNGSTFGLSDASSPYLVPSSTVLPSGDYFLFANSLASTGFGVTSDVVLPSNAIENSSYTMILKDSILNTINSIFVTDGGTGDAANDAGSLISPDLTIGPDGLFLPAGFFRDVDGGMTTSLQDFYSPNLTGTPGAPNSVIPEPSTMLLLGVGLVGLSGVTKRKLKK